MSSGVQIISRVTLGTRGIISDVLSRIVSEFEFQNVVKEFGYVPGSRTRHQFSKCKTEAKSRLGTRKATRCAWQQIGLEWGDRTTHASRATDECAGALLRSCTDIVYNHWPHGANYRRNRTHDYTLHITCISLRNMLLKLVMMKHHQPRCR